MCGSKTDRIHGRCIQSVLLHALGTGLLVFAIGLPTLICGIALVANPLFATRVLTIVLSLSRPVRSVPATIV